MKLTLRIALLPGVLAVLSVPLFGWGAIGHMAVAYVAYQQLNPATRSRVDALLKLYPGYDKWKAQIPAGTPAADQPMMLFMIAATWPDQIKSKQATPMTEQQVETGPMVQARLRT